MDRQNITLSLPKDLLREVKHLAVDRGTSISALLEQYLNDCLVQYRLYEKTRSEELDVM